MDSAVKMDYEACYKNEQDRCKSLQYENMELKERIKSLEKENSINTDIARGNKDDYKIMQIENANLKGQVEAFKFCVGNY